MENCPDTSNKNPVKAIRMKCVDCSGGQTREVEKCPVKTCALYPFRMGSNPFYKKTSRVYTEEERQAIAERLRKAKENKNERISKNESL